MSRFNKYMAGQEQSLVTPYYLSQDKDLFVHWADWDHALTSKRNYISENYFSVITELKNCIIYVMTHEPRKTRSLSLFDFYKIFYVQGEDNLFGEVYSVSTNGIEWEECGNGKSPTWFNIQQFLYVLFDGIWSHEIPVRRFRLHFNAPVEISFVHGAMKRTKINVHQITENGVLLGLRKSTYRDLCEAGHCLIKLNFELLYDLKDMSHERLKYFLEEQSLSIKLATDRLNKTYKVSMKDMNPCSSIFGKHPHTLVDGSFLFVPFESLNPIHGDEKDVIRRDDISKALYNIQKTLDLSLAG